MNGKNNKDLVKYCKVQLGCPYWYGTFGQIATTKLLEEKGNQYPRFLSKARQDKAVARGDIGKKVHDCYGLPKGYLMSESPDAPAVYNAAFDISADDAFRKATEKGDISTLPEIEGVILWRKGHAGVYIGGGREIEARGFDYGVVEDAVSNTKFTNWFKMPEIEYIESSEAAGDQSPGPAPSKPDEELQTYVVVKGDTLTKIAAKFGVTVKELVAWNGIANPDIIRIGQRLTIRKSPAPSEKPAEYFEGIVSTKTLPLNIRKGSSLDSQVIGSLPKGSSVKISYETGGWYKLYGREGFVSAKFIDKI